MLVWTILRNLARKCGICGALVLVDVRRRTLFYGSCVVAECLSKPDCSFSDTPYYMWDFRSSSVLKMVFQVTPVLSKLLMSLLGLLHKGLAILDLIVVTVLTTWSPVAAERCWCRLMTRPCGVLALSPGRKWHRRIGELHLKEFETLFSVCPTSWNPVMAFSHFCCFHMLVLYSTAGRHDSTYLPLLATKIFLYPILTVCS
jgi:hypothetical protein